MHPNTDDPLSLHRKVHTTLDACIGGCASATSGAFMVGLSPCLTGPAFWTPIPLVMVTHSSRCIFPSCCFLNPFECHPSTLLRPFHFHRGVWFLHPLCHLPVLCDHADLQPGPPATVSGDGFRTRFVPPSSLPSPTNLARPQPVLFERPRTGV